MEYGDPRIPENVWNKIYPCPVTGCWLWAGATSSSGYGYTQRARGSNKVDRVHRVMLRRATGVEEDPNLLACHKCDVPSCCNPEHLFWGTPRENTQDMMRKGRNAYQPCVMVGSEHPRAVLTDETVLLIRSLHGPDWPYSALATRFNVSKSQIGKVVKRQSWTHV